MKQNRLLSHLPVSASSVKACTNSWSVGELSPSSGGQGCIPYFCYMLLPCLLLGAGTSCQCSAASLALLWSSSSLQRQEELFKSGSCKGSAIKCRLNPYLYWTFLQICHFFVKCYLREYRYLCDLRSYI